MVFILQVLSPHLEMNGTSPKSSDLEDYWLYIGAFSVVKAIGTNLRSLINSGLAKWHMKVLMENVTGWWRGVSGVEIDRADAGRNSRTQLTDQTLMRERG